MSLCCFSSLSVLPPFDSRFGFNHGKKATKQSRVNKAPGSCSLANSKEDKLNNKDNIEK